MRLTVKRKIQNHSFYEECCRKMAVYLYINIPYKLCDLKLKITVFWIA